MLLNLFVSCLQPKSSKQRSENRLIELSRPVYCVSFLQCNWHYGFYVRKNNNNNNNHVFFYLHLFTQRLLVIAFPLRCFQYSKFTQALNEVLAVGCSYVIRDSLPINITRLRNSWQTSSCPMNGATAEWQSIDRNGRSFSIDWYIYIGICGPLYNTGSAFWIRSHMLYAKVTAGTTCHVGTE